MTAQDQNEDGEDNLAKARKLARDQVAVQDRYVEFYDTIHRPIMIKVGKALKDVRQAKGISAEELAQLTWSHASFINGFEAGIDNYEMSISWLIRAAKALDITVTEFFERVEKTV